MVTGRSLAVDTRSVVLSEAIGVDPEVVVAMFSAVENKHITCQHHVHYKHTSDTTGPGTHTTPAK